MDKNTLKNALIREAQRDVFNEVGRVFIDNFAKAFEVNRDQIVEALKDLPYPWRVVDNILLITFSARV